MSLFEFPHERLFYSWDRQTVSTFLADGDPQPNLEKLGAKKPNAPDKPPTLLASAAGRKMQLCHTQERTWEQGTHNDCPHASFLPSWAKPLKENRQDFCEWLPYSCQQPASSFILTAGFFLINFPFFLIRVQHEGRWPIHYDQPLRNAKPAFASLNGAKSPVMANIMLSMD